MFNFDVLQHIPLFIRNDKNGYAVAKAIEAAMNAMNGIIDDGVKCLYDYDTMPEWRLDELAWETNCLYDYNADVEAKREWIRNALPLYRMFGTPRALYEYLGGYFGDASITEGPEAFHFAVTLPGSWTPEGLAWATNATRQVKNVRSVLDSFTFRGVWPLNRYADGALYARELGVYQVAAEAFENGWYTDEAGIIMMDEDNVILTVEG